MHEKGYSEYHLCWARDRLGAKNYRQTFQDHTLIAFYVPQDPHKIQMSKEAINAAVVIFRNAGIEENVKVKNADGVVWWIITNSDITVLDKFLMLDLLSTTHTFQDNNPYAVSPSFFQEYSFKEWMKRQRISKQSENVYAR
jgi:hypothetical protein